MWDPAIELGDWSEMDWGDAEAKVLLVCGGRDFSDYAAACKALDAVYRKHPEVFYVRHGAARGADTLAGRWAVEQGLTEERMPANWNRYGKAAGHIRNAEMLAREPRPFACVAFPGGRGTQDMINKCKAAGVPVWQPLGRK